MRRFWTPLLLAAALTGCGNARIKHPTAESPLGLDTVVLYRNGIGYFERTGEIEGGILRLKVRKDQINDLLKSLTVVERDGGRAVSISMPLDAQSWANAALATLAPGRGSLAQVLDELRGTWVALGTTEGSLEGRIVMVEFIDDVPDPSLPTPRSSDGPAPLGQDFRVTLLDGDEMKVVRLSKVKSVRFEDQELALQFNRSLDATAGEGMFEQVEIEIRLAEESSQDLLVSYVVEAPMWKPTYRVVLPEEGKGKALLQAWAVVDNVSGEDWSDVELSLTSGAPIAFRYDLHTPRAVPRRDLTESGVHKQAAVALGETTITDEEEQEAYAEDEGGDGDRWRYDADKTAADDGLMGQGQARLSAAPAAEPKPASGRAEAPPPPPPPPAPPMEAKKEKPRLDIETLSQSTLATARASQVSGLARFDIGDRVTIPDGTSTMVAIINSPVEAEETFLFRPGGAGSGYEQNPYRVVRFKNTTPFVLEPGPLSIYSGGSFVGEGLAETVGTNTSATIPFAVEPNILVSSKVKREGDEMRLLKIVRGVLEVERFAKTTTTWSVRGAKTDGYKVFIRHPKAGWNYELVERPEGTEDLADGYLVPIDIPAGQKEGELTVAEQTPAKTQLSIWDTKAIELLEGLLVTTTLGDEDRKALEPVVELRREIGRIDTQVAGLREQEAQLDARADQTRQNLEALKEDPQAEPLRAKLRARLDEFQTEGNRVGREIVELSNQRLEKKIELEDLLQDLELGASNTKPSAP